MDYSFSEVIKFINDRIIWSNAFIILCIVTGLYFSFRTSFLQVRYFKEMIKLLFTEGSNDKGVSPFQAFSIAIAGRVGVGNIAGVATAIAMGGPGAIFWMWFIAFIGSASAFIEATLGQVYKENKNGEYRGGPAFYLEKGLGKKWYAYLFAAVTMISCVLFLPGVQANAIATSMNHAFNFKVEYVGIGIGVLLAITVFGGAKKIGKIAEIIVPFMAGAYILMALIIIFMNISAVPSVFKLIFSSAFNMEATFSGIFGMAIAWGVKRGIYSNEAGQGTAPHAAAAAATSHPAKQGLVQAFSVYVDTLFVCTATALMILFTGKYNVKNPNGGFIVENLPGVEEGSAFTSQAIAVHFPSIANEFVAIALMLFAFTTIMAYYFIAESNLIYLMKNKKSKLLVWVLRIIILASIYYGTISSAGAAWAIGDIGVGMMAWINIIGILLLGNIALKVLKDYDQQRSQGLDPVFDPIKLNIKNTTEWDPKEWEHLNKDK